MGPSLSTVMSRLWGDISLIIRISTVTERFGHILSQKNQQGWQGGSVDVRIPRRDFGAPANLGHFWPLRVAKNELRTHLKEGSQVIINNHNNHIKIYVTLFSGMEGHLCVGFVNLHRALDKGKLL